MGKAFDHVLAALVTCGSLIALGCRNDMAAPLIRARHWTFVPLVGLLLVVCYGVLNLIAGTCVLAAAEWGRPDFMLQMRQRKLHMELRWEAQRRLLTLCRDPNTDRSGTI